MQFQDTYMVHALRRVSFSTCLADLFAFAARDPGQPLDRQYCHVFKTPLVSLISYNQEKSQPQWYVITYKF